MDVNIYSTKDYENEPHLRTPGQGHTDFEDIFARLKEAGYDGWVSVEILPKPDPDTAAAQAAEYLRPLVDRYNAQ